MTRQILERVNRSGKIFLTHARLDGQLALRMCIGQIRTEHRHVRQAWQLLCATAADIG